MQRLIKTLLLSAVLLAPLFATGCVYYPARPYRPYAEAVWVPAHWAGPHGDVWVGGHWR